MKCSRLQFILSLASYWRAIIPPDTPIWGQEEDPWGLNNDQQQQRKRTRGISSEDNRSINNCIPPPLPLLQWCLSQPSCHVWGQPANLYKFGDERNKTSFFLRRKLQQSLIRIQSYIQIGHWCSLSSLLCSPFLCCPDNHQPSTAERFTSIRSIYSPRDINLPLSL